MHCRIDIPLPAIMLLAASCLFIIAGCGHSGPELVPVKGQVTYGGGPWPKPGVFFFTPVDSGAGRAGSANFDTEGRFQVNSYQVGEGLYTGIYRLSAQCWNGEVVIGGPLPLSFVPPKYRSGQSSDLEITVEPGRRSVEVNLNIPKK